MRRLATLFVLAAVWCVSVTAGTIVDSATGEDFPDTVSFTYGGVDYQLQATGVSTRKKFFVKVYSIASYLQGLAEVSGSPIDTIMNGNKARQLTMRWVRNVGASRIQDGYRESLAAVMSDEDYARLTPEINQFLGLFSVGATKGDDHVLRWMPDGTVEVWINESKAGAISANGFGHAVWSMWFSDKSVVKRSQLIERM